jgi:hypothetical protein
LLPACELQGEKEKTMKGHTSFRAVLILALGMAMLGLAATSANADLTTVAAFDFNAESSPTQDGFLGIAGPGGNDPALGPQGGTQDGVTLIVTGGGGYRDRKETSSKGGDLTGHEYAAVLRDFLTNDSGSGSEMTIDLTGLDADDSGDTIQNS